MNNCPYPYWDSLDKFCFLEQYIVRNTGPEKLNRNDVFFVNVSEDRQVVDYTYSNGNMKGNIAITNRATLLKFLRIAKETDTYKYIFMDIRFVKGINTDIDSALFTQIDSMRDISYSTHSDIQNHERAISSKAAINDYFTTIINTNFTRYQFLQGDKESAPLRIYTSIDSINNKTIKKWGPFYYSDNNICQNSPFMRIPEDFWFGHDVGGHQNYFDLGPLLLDSMIVEGIKEPVYSIDDWKIELNGKIVIIGDLVNDLHDTYVGLQPGPYLVYLAYKELCNRRHFVPWNFVITAFILYIFISLFIIERKTVWSFLPYIKKVRSKFVLFILDMLGYSAILSILTIIMYIFFKQTYNIFLPSLLFSLLSLYVNFKYKEK